MRLQDYLNVILKRWWLIGLVGVSAAVTAYAISKLQRPVYRAQATYVATINRADSGAGFFIAETLNSFISLVHNPDTFAGISQDLQLDISAEQLLGNVRMQAQPDARKIVIEADSPSTADPRRIIDKVGEVLLANVAEANRLAEGQDRINVRRFNPGPVYKAKPQTKINTLAGGVLGLILGTLLAFILEFLDDTLKTASDVERFAGLTTIGAIPSGAAQGAPGRARLRPASASGIVERKDVHGKRT